MKTPERRPGSMTGSGIYAVHYRHIRQLPSSTGSKYVMNGRRTRQMIYFEKKVYFMQLIFFLSISTSGEHSIFSHIEHIVY